MDLDDVMSSMLVLRGVRAISRFKRSFDDVFRIDMPVGFNI